MEFIDRELTSPAGGFYSAIDADSDGKEGAYYIWSYNEIIELLGEEEGSLFANAYDITEEGNFEGSNIPNLIFTDVDALLEEFQLSLDELEEGLEASRKILLLERREAKSYPHLDDKILTSWNALMIVALTKAAGTFNESSLLEKAERAISFLEKNLMEHDQLYARYKDGEKKYLAYLDDYSFLLWSYVELYEATGKIHYLKKAKDIADKIEKKFADPINSGFFFTDIEAEKLLVRQKIALDNALPSGNGVASLQLWRLAKLTNDIDLMNKVEKALHTFADEITNYPSSTLTLLCTQLALYSENREIKITGSNIEKVLMLLNTTFRPYDVWFIRHDATKQVEIEIWEQHVCHAKITELPDIFAELSK